MARVRPVRATALWGVAVALLTWKVGLAAPGPGLDASWNAALTMALKDGLQFGQQVVFSYGPLGFLQSPYVWYGDLGLVAYLFSAAIYVCFCIALVWAMGRQLPAIAAAVVAFVLLGFLPAPEQPLLIAVVASLAFLESEWGERPQWAFVVLAAALAGIEALVKLSTGPVVAAVFLLALIGGRAGRTRIAAYVVLLLGALALLWAVCGQSFAAIPDFLANTWQIVSGYSTAMLREVEVSPWKVTLATIAAATITLGLVACTWALGGFRDRRARLAGTVAMAIAAFAVFKEGVVRTDAGHLNLYFATACVLWIAIPWGGGCSLSPRGRQDSQGAGRGWGRWLMLAGLVAIAAVGIPVRQGLGTDFNPIDNLKLAFQETRTALTPSRLTDLTEAGRAGMVGTYALDPATVAALQRRGVAIEPWEAGVAWAYRLDWSPLPVFQNYSAYTSRLDRLNAAAAESGSGPGLILRENPQLVLPEFATPDLDNRYFGWDPPEQQRAVLCNFRPIRTSLRWQVLARIPDRCGPARQIASVATHSDETVRVPEPGPGEAVFVRIHGAGVGGLERISTLLLHAATRRLVLDGGRSYRLIPEIASDGLLLRGRGAFTRSGPFATIPETATIELTGIDASLRFDFFAIRVTGR